MKLASCIVVCACTLASRAVEAFVPFAASARGLDASTGVRRASSSSAPSPRLSGLSTSSAFTGASGAATSFPSSRHVSGRPSSSSTTMGLFGLGAPEIAVCLVVAAVVLGPDKLAGVAKDVGKMAGELKDVPAEFQAGIEEGEAALQKTKALGAKSADADAVVDAEKVPEKEEAT